jgi:hypothetical protein
MPTRIKNGSFEARNASKLPIERKLSVATAIVSFLASVAKLLGIIGLL